MSERKPNHSIVDLRDRVLDAIASRAQRTVSPEDIAQDISRDIAGTPTPAANWVDLLAPIRRAAVDLAQAGRLVIYRKGKPVDPLDFKGVYRLGLPRHD